MNRPNGGVAEFAGPCRRRRLVTGVSVVLGQHGGGRQKPALGKLSRQFAGVRNEIRCLASHVAECQRPWRASWTWRHRREQGAGADRRRRGARSAHARSLPHPIRKRRSSAKPHPHAKRGQNQGAAARSHLHGHRIPGGNGLELIQDLADPHLTSSSSPRIRNSRCPRSSTGGRLPRQPVERNASSEACSAPAAHLRATRRGVASQVAGAMGMNGKPKPHAELPARNPRPDDDPRAPADVLPQSQ